MLTICIMSVFKGSKKEARYALTTCVVLDAIVFLGCL